MGHLLLHHLIIAAHALGLLAPDCKLHTTQALNTTHFTLGTEYTLQSAHLQLHFRPGFSEGQLLTKIRQIASLLNAHMHTANSTMHILH